MPATPDVPAAPAEARGHFTSFGVTIMPPLWAPTLTAANTSKNVTVTTEIVCDPDIVLAFLFRLDPQDRTVRIRSTGRQLLIGNRFWPYRALARSLKPKAWVSMGAE